MIQVLANAANLSRTLGSDELLRKPDALKCTLAAFLVGHGSLAVINVAVVLTLAGWVSF